MPILACPFVLFLAFPSLPQQPLYEFRGFGSSTANLGDVDGDGVSDFLAGDQLHGVSGRTLKTLFHFPEVFVAPFNSAEFVRGAGDLDGDGFGDVLLARGVVSGAELLQETVGRGGRIEVLYPFHPPLLNLGIPGGFAVLGDVDGDGLEDFAGGWPDYYIRRCPGDHPAFTHGESGGEVTLYASGGVPGVLASGNQTFDAFGGVVARLGDLDGDGLADLGVATRIVPLDSTLFCSFPGGRYAQARSSASGAILWEVPVAPRTMTAVDDLDGDGTDDVAMGFPYAESVELRSGRTGALLRSIVRPLTSPGSHLFGNALLAWPDEDGDGLGELVVSAPQPVVYPIGVPGGPSSAGPGLVLVYSTGTGKLLGLLHGKERDQEFGRSIARLDDLDGDGRPELAVGSTRPEGGLVQVFSPRPLGHLRGR